MGLVETKIKLSKLSRINGCVPADWRSCNNFHLSSKGRTWVGWNPAVWTCVIHAIFTQHITLSVKNKGGLEGFLTVAYGLNSQSERKELWNNLYALNIQNWPWLVAGDFNTARYTSEKIGGKSLTFLQLSSFNNFIASCFLFDLSSVGNHWSWNNSFGCR